MTNTVLQAKNLSWSVDNKTIIDQLNFTIGRGETVGIVGPNGAGKTTLLKCLYGEHSNIQGQVNLKGKALSDFSARQVAKQIAVVSQHQEPVFNLTVTDIVRMGLIPHKGLFASDNQADLDKINHALTKVDLLAKQQQHFSTLSGGEQQRVLIARAIVQDGEILILDEPTNHLDIYYQHQILSLTAKLNTTLILTIHDLNLAAQYCDRLILMDQGKIVAVDTPAQVLTQSILKQVFKLACHVDNNPYTNVPRITFAGIGQKEHLND